MDWLFKSAMNQGSSESMDGDTHDTIQTIQKIVILPYAVYSIDTGGLRIVMLDLIPLPLTQRV
jgi:hypothetical protein